MRGFAARRPPFTLFRYLLSAFVPTLVVAILFFVLILEITDLFGNIFKFLQGEVPLSGVLRTMALYVPKCVSFALPVATLFSVSFTLGNLYANNELIVVFGSGIPLASFAAPLLALSLAISGASFVFEDRVVLPTSQEKARLTRELLKVSESRNSNDVTILSRQKTVLWNVKRFDSTLETLTGVTVVRRSPDGAFLSRLDAQSASWAEGKWVFSGVRRYFSRAPGGPLTDASYGTYSEEGLDEPPSSFASVKGNVAEMNLSEAGAYVDFRRRSGLPFQAEQAEYYKRFSFALTPFLVTLLSTVLTGRYRKNVLLMSLLLSLATGTVYYVAQMISMLLAKNGLISPFAGAMAPSFLFAAIVAASYARKRT